MFPNASGPALDLLDKLLQFSPQKRLTAEQVRWRTRKIGWGGRGGVGKGECEREREREREREEEGSRHAEGYRHADGEHGLC